MKSSLPLTEADIALAGERIPPPKRKRPPLTPGRLVYLLYHYPRSVWRDGFVWHYHLWKGRREMTAAVGTLSPPPLPPGPSVRIHYLTGKRYVPLTIISALSAQHAMGRAVQPVLCDDGSLDEADAAEFRRVFPSAIVTRKEDIAANLDRVLPTARFPFLRRLRLGYIHLRKLTDIQTAGLEWRLVLDSDIFFFQRPAQLLDLLARPAWFHMQDCEQSYGAPVATLDALAGTPVHPRVNVGICHVHAAAIDWDFVEHCARVLLHRHGFSYYLEQALMAVLLARASAEPLDENYLVYPTPEQARVVQHAALHYVDKSHLTMMRYGWRQVLATSAEARPHG
jgi:hypothetical protein